MTRNSQKTTLRDRLSRLNHAHVCRMLGPHAHQLTREGHALALDPIEQVSLSDSRLRASFPNAEVDIRLDAAVHGRLRCHCNACPVPCAHLAATLTLVLEHKMALGLSVPPSDLVPIELLSQKELLQRALYDRAERAQRERMLLRSTQPSEPWTDYLVTSAHSGKTYRLALRGWRRGESYCSCPDFRNNTLGTCKHILHALGELERRFGAAVRQRAYRRQRFSVCLRYSESSELWLRAPESLDSAARKIAGPLLREPVDLDEGIEQLLCKIEQLESLGHAVQIYPDARDFIERRRAAVSIAPIVADIRQRPSSHPLRTGLLRRELLPYQLEGVAFAAGAGRALLADDMGLGKTVQAIGVAELLAREADIARVLIICPASVKGQWRSEIERFSRRNVQLVNGGALRRAEQYESGAFFTVCNYEQVLRDLAPIERASWDLIILDEAQRIKNWQAKTTRVVRGLRSPFALALTGTPLENRLEELYSVVSFIDERLLGPAFRFFHRYRVVDERGRVQGYHNLAELRGRLAPVLLRRTRPMVIEQLPRRDTEIVRVVPTAQQKKQHDGYMNTARRIMRKEILTEADLRQLRQALLKCRLAANGTLLVDQQHPGYSSKLEELGKLVRGLAADRDRKMVLFSEWTRMLSLIEPTLQQAHVDYVRLDGSVPQTKRQQLVTRFQADPSCRCFVATNAGATGLNLQAANTVINVDLPWSPAVLEQRISRVHRMGQGRAVEVFVLVTEDTIEERLLGILSAKRELAQAALDPSSTTGEVALPGGIDSLRRRLEVLLGAKPDAPIDGSQRARVAAQSAVLARTEPVENAARELADAVQALAAELLPHGVDPDAARHLSELGGRGLVTQLRSARDGGLEVTLSLPGVLRDRPMAG